MYSTDIYMHALLSSNQIGNCTFLFDVCTSWDDRGVPPPSAFQRKWPFLWLARVRDIWEERNDRVFRDTNRDPCEVWSLVRFHVFLGASLSKLFL